MSEGRSRLGRLTDAVLGGARAARDKARELRDEFRTTDEPERALVAPLLPDEEIRYVGLAPVRAPENHRAGSQLADRVNAELAEALDPRALFGLLNIVNPVAWVDAVLTPVRIAAGVLLLPGKAALLAAGTPETAEPEPAPGGAPREPLPLTDEQEAFRALFRLSRYRPLADQLAEIAYRRRYVFSGDLATLAGSLLLFLERYTGTPLAVTDTHLHLLRMGRRPDPDREDRRRPQVLWSVPRRRIARIESEHGARLMQFPSTIVFDDGSWIRIVNPATRDDQSRFLAAVRDLPGQRPTA
ncbi:hypothetical protein ACLQ20_09550 [Micromonospora sp. DT46]|uniref:hypothetical protein n=1 Tax=unclassified Micromonospora TaxID=2617518 RepID=UPI00124BBF13|nr:MULTISPECIES: hypothetical protein [unclassified Micromonospora]KAB1156385.1 hypothetical protein F6X68_11690 [Micromonospora sp. AMSO12t]WSG00154.1 hypothetical protein OG989_20970 [Micromonospora sp. NBC_01740]